MAAGMCQLSGNHLVASNEPVNVRSGAAFHAAADIVPAQVGYVLQIVSRDLPIARMSTHHYNPRGARGTGGRSFFDDRQNNPPFKLLKDWRAAVVS